MGWLMEPIYTVISWILLRWHWVWDAILPNGHFLGTTWDWVLAIVFLVITVRIILFPIFVKQIRSQRAMQALQPKMKELQQKHKGDQQTLREEMMKLYQTEKVNPLMGCLPLLLQIPVFFGLFHVLSHLSPYTKSGASTPASEKTLYGWTVDKFDSGAIARLFNAPIPARFADSADQLSRLAADGTTVKIVAGILVLIMMVTTFLTSRQMILKTGWSQDPQQRMIQKLMLYGIPFSLLLSGWYFPIGVIIYWVTQNLFSLGQQFWVLHKYPPPVTEGNIPLKGARAGATDSPGSVLARFIQVKPAAPKAPTLGGFLNGLGKPTRGGLFRRKAEAVEQASPEARSLAPRPGAKPIKQGPLPRVTADESASPNGASSPDAAQAPSATPAKSSSVKSTPAAKSTPAVKPAARKPVPGKPAPPASANGSGAADSASGGSASGGPPPGGTTSGATPSGGAASSGAASAGTASGGSAKPNSGAAGSGAARGRAAAKKVSNRKGQPHRKGGAKR
jgi:YidC/Oxa1 family membrane protein insertase